MTEWIKVEDRLPEDDTEVWVMNEEYGIIWDIDPFVRQMRLNIRLAKFYRRSGWKIMKFNEETRVAYWRYPDEFKDWGK